MKNAGKASIHLRNQRYLRENFLEFIALQGIYKSFTALYFEALCFNEVAELNDIVL